MINETVSNKNNLKWIMLGVLALIWGSSFILMKQGLKGFRPDQVASIRMMVACIATFPMGIRKFRDLTFDKARYMAVVGVVGSGIPAFLFATAQTRISSYLAGMLNSLTPVFTMILGLLFFRSKFTWMQMLGVCIGFLGAAGLIFIRSGGGINSDAFFAMLIVIATFCYGISVNTIKSFLAGQDTLLISSVSLLFVGIPYGIYLFTTDFLDRFHTVPDASWAFGCLVTLSVFGTALSNIIYFHLVKIAGPLFASAVTYIMPVVSLLWGFFDHEVFHPLHLVAFLAILGGVMLINRKIS
jgi:drug/metabolite transporter (DMT)-like permease